MVSKSEKKPNIVDKVSKTKPKSIKRAVVAAVGPQLCKDTAHGLNKIFKVSVWSMPGNPSPDTLLVFVGQNGEASKHLLSKLEKGDKISAADDKALAAAFGKNWPSKLGTKMLAPKSTTKIHYVYDMVVNDDDTVLTLRNKIADVLGGGVSGRGKGTVDWNDVYTWCVYGVRDVGLHWQTMLEAALYRNIVYNSVGAIEDMYFNLTGVKLVSAVALDKVLNLQEAGEFIKAHSKTNMMRAAMGIEYTEDGCVVPFPVNPFDMARSEWSSTRQDNTDIMHLKWGLQCTVETFTPYQRHVCAVVANKNESPANATQSLVQKMYFPKWKGRSLVVPDDIAIDKKYHSIRDQFKHDCSLRFVKVRNHDNLSFAKWFDVDEAFHAFQDIGVDIPFIKKSNRTTGAMVKLHKSIMTDNMKAEVEGWTKSEVFKNTPILDSIVLKVLMRHDSREVGRGRGVPPPSNPEGSYASLTILSNGTCDVKFKFSFEHHVGLVELQKCISSINTVLQKLDKSLLPFDTGVVNEQQLQCNTKICMSVAASLRTDVKIATVGAINETVKASYGSAFAVMQPDSSSHLVYKRIDQFTTDESISLYIARQNRMNKDLQGSQDLKRKLQDMFDLTPKQADKYKAEWREIVKSTLAARNIMKKVVAKPAQNVNLRVWATGLYYKYVIDGITSIAQYHRVVRLIKCILYDASRFDGPLPNKKTNKAAADKKAVAAAAVPQEGVVHGDGQGDGDDDIDVHEVDDLLYLDDDTMLESLMKEFASFGEDEEDSEAPPQAPKGDVDEKDEDEPEPEQGHGGVAKPSVPIYKSIVLDELDKADPALFVFTSETTYAKTCQKSSNRQPIVITKEEAEKQAPHVNNILNYGSTPELASKNHYICPDVWWPKSRTAMTRETYVTTKGKKPDASVKEEAIVFFDKDYWHENGVYKQRWVKYLKASVHPKFLCLPCCFKTKLSESEKGPAGPKCGVETGGNERYVKSSTGAAEIGRFATLPPSLHALLGNGPNCGSGLMMSAKTDCFFRQGVPLHLQSFLQVMAKVLQNDHLQNADDVVKALDDNLTLELFMALENGWLCKKFISTVDPLTIYNQEKYNEFKTWYTHRMTRMAKASAGAGGCTLDMQQIANVVEKITFNTNSPRSKLVLREFVLFWAFKAFKDYIKAGGVVKTHEFLMHLFNMHLPWLNMNGYNVVVVEMDGEGEVYLPCMQYNFRDNRPFVFLLKHNTYYEPIVHAKLVGHDLNVQSRFLMNEYKQISRIVRHLEKKCDIDWIKADARAHDVIDAIKQVGLKVSYTVINYDMQVVGFFLADSALFVPLQQPCSMVMALENVCGTRSKIAFVSDVSVFLKKKGVTIDEAKRILSAINKEMSGEDAYFVVDDAASSNDVLYIKSHDTEENNAATSRIPLNYTGSQEDEVQLQVGAVSDLNMMVKWQDSDARKVKVDTTQTTDALYASLWNEAIKIITRSRLLTRKVLLLRHHSNPLPFTVKRRVVDAIFINDEKVNILQSRTYNQGSLDRLDSKSFLNKLCSTIGNQLDCSGQCMWVVYPESDLDYAKRTASAKKGDDANRRMGARCKLNAPLSIYDYLYNRVVGGILKPFVPLRPLVVNEMFLDTGEVIILTDSDIRSGKFAALMMGKKGMDAWGFKRQDDVLNVGAMLKDGNDKTDSEMGKLLPIKDASLLEDIYAKTQKDFKNYKSYPLALDGSGYTASTLFDYFGRVYNATRKSSKKSSKDGDKIKSGVVARIMSDYTTDPVKVFKRLLYNTYLTKNLNKLPDIGDEDKVKANDLVYIESQMQKAGLDGAKLQEMLGDPQYHPSDYDVEIMAEMVGVNCVTLGRTSKKGRNPTHQWCYGQFADREYTIILEQAFDRTAKPRHDVYKAVVNKNKKVALLRDDLDNVTREYISKACQKYIFKKP